MAGVNAVGGAPVPQVQAPQMAAKAQGNKASAPISSQGGQGDTLTISAAAVMALENAAAAVGDLKHHHHHRESIAEVLLTYPNYQAVGNHPGAAGVLAGGAAQPGSTAPVAAAGSAGGAAGGAGGAGGGK